MPVDQTKFKKFQTGFNRALDPSSGVRDEELRQLDNQKARENHDAQLEQEHARQREAARRERQGI